MIEWFEALSVAGKVFVCVAIPSTLILVIQTVMTFFGFGDGGDGTDMPDLDGDGVPDGIFGSNDAGETDNFEVAESSGCICSPCAGLWPSSASSVGLA